MPSIRDTAHREIEAGDKVALLVTVICMPATRWRSLPIICSYQLGQMFWLRQGY